MWVWQSHFSVPSWSGLVASDTSESSTFWACTVEVFKDEKMIPGDQPRSRCEMHCMKSAKIDFRFKERYQQSFFFLKHQRLDEEQLKMEKLASSVSWIDVWSNLTLKCKLPRQNYGGYGRCTSRLATRPFLLRVTFCCLETLLQQAVTLEGICPLCFLYKSHQFHTI